MGVLQVHAAALLDVEAFVLDAESAASSLASVFRNGHDGFAAGAANRWYDMFAYGASVQYSLSTINSVTTRTGKPIWCSYCPGFRWRLGLSRRTSINPRLVHYDPAPLQRANHLSYSCKYAPFVQRVMIFSAISGCSLRRAPSALRTARMLR